MKNWEFGKVKGSEIAIDERLSDMMGIVEGGYVYSTLFEYNDEGPKKYELILSMYPQENYRTLTNITLYMKDVPGSSAQAAKFLGERGINILNSISLDGISDTIIIWKMLADLSFAGEVGILKEKFDALKSAMSKLGITGMTVSHVMGCGVQKGKPEYYRGVPVEASLLPKVQVDIVVSKVPVRTVIETAKKVLYTGHIGDGKIFVYDVENVVKVRTGEEGFDALQDVE